MLIRRVSISAFLIAVCLVAASCNRTTDAETAAPFVAAGGEAQIRNALAQDDPALAAFGVVRFNDLPDISNVAAVRLFGIGGGDQAMNGLRVYLGFVSAHDERGFLLGDFYDYRVITASPGRIDLEIDEDVMDDAGQISQLTRRVIVSWTELEQEPSPNPEFPTTVTITPAQ
ncbi:MAG: hypothetical protein K2P70_16125 [Hyphomonadaceae bacterium]|nr:hypothetical protein [Hyphomonadaceae bacterium]